MQKLEDNWKESDGEVCPEQQFWWTGETLHETAEGSWEVVSHPLARRHLHDPVTEDKPMSYWSGRRVTNMVRLSVRDARPERLRMSDEDADAVLSAPPEEPHLVRDQLDLGGDARPPGAYPEIPPREPEEKEAPLEESWLVAKHNVPKQVLERLKTGLGRLQQIRFMPQGPPPSAFRIFLSPGQAQC